MSRLKLKELFAANSEIVLNKDTEFESKRMENDIWCRCNIKNVALKGSITGYFIIIKINSRRYKNSKFVCT